MSSILLRRRAVILGNNLTSFFADNEISKSIYHYEWRNYLNEKNKTEVYRLVALPRCNQRFSFFTRKTVNFFLQTAKILEMPPDVPYVAIDILDR